MKKLVLLLLLMQTTRLFGEKPKPQPNPADYTATVNVVFSRYVITPGRALNNQQLETLIDGQQVELFSETAAGVLAPGIYKAMMISTPSKGGGYFPKQPNGFDVFLIYRLLLPDGSTREFTVVGLGPKEPYSSAPAPPAPNP